MVFVLYSCSNYSFVCTLSRVLPESPRWLYSQGRVDEAERILEMFAYKNSGQSKKVILKREVKANASAQPSLLDILRHPILRSLTLNNLFTW